MLVFFQFFFYLFSSIASISAVMVILSTNAIYSGLFLIWVFFNSALLLLLLDLEYLAIIFIIVYVGAVMVLFLLCGYETLWENRYNKIYYEKLTKI